MSDRTLEVTPGTERANDWRRTSPVAVIFFFGRILKTAFDAGWAAIAPLWAAISSGNSIWILPGVLALLGLFVAWAVLSWLRFRYRLVDDKLMVNRGVLQREKLTIEFSKVQNTRVLEPFYVRPFELALFEIDTAGSSGKEVTLGGIDLELARALRDSVVEEQRDATATEDEALDAPVDRLIIERSPLDISIYGLTHNGLLWVAIVFGAVASQIDWDDENRVLGLIDQTLNFSSLGVAGIVVLVLLGLMVLPLLSIAGAQWRYHGYRLLRSGQTWRRHAGLVSKHDETVKQHKIQALIWKQNFIARALGRINLQLRQVSAGVAASGGGAAAAGRRAFVVPALRPAEVEQLSAQLLDGAEIAATEFSRVDRKYIRKNLLWGWSWVTALMTIAPVLFLGLMGLLTWPLLMTLGTLIVWLRWRKLGYAIRGQFGVLRSGFVGSRLTVFPLFKVQRVDLRQSPSQRRHGLAHLTLHLASNSTTLPWVKLSDAQLIRDLVLYHVETDQRSWF